MSTVTRDFSVIGTSVPRVDGIDKVTGRARYAGDLIISGMIEGKFLRSPYAHALIRSIDTRDAEALPGVVAVVTSKDFTDISPLRRLDGKSAEICRAQWRASVEAA